MSNITDQELMSQYVLLSRTEYQASIRALECIEIISNILDRGYKYDIPDMIRMVLGKEIQKDD